MDQLIPAVFDSGVFRPLQPVELAEGTQVQVQLANLKPPVSEEVDEETRKSWNEYVDRMESLPSKSPPDELTNRDHDRIIYGG
jgi:predicted DNA-binding antitoxin AbrB/MazE fold protein